MNHRVVGVRFSLSDEALWRNRLLASRDCTDPSKEDANEWPSIHSQPVPALTLLSRASRFSSSRMRRIFAISAAATLPMAVLACRSWRPCLADRFAGDGHVPMAKALIVSLVIGMVGAVRPRCDPRRTQTADPPLGDRPRGALAPALPGARAAASIVGRVSLVVIPLILAFTFSAGSWSRSCRRPSYRSFATLLESDAGKAFLDGAFGWYGLILVMFLFNTVLGEELLFCGYLLPRKSRPFGRGDWVANGLLFAGYHLHPPCRGRSQGDAARDVHHRIPDKAVSERMDRNRGAQRPERVPRDRVARDRPLRRLSPAGPQVPQGSSLAGMLDGCRSRLSVQVIRSF